MENKILYFGYGANSQREMMEAITGNKNLVGQQGILRGFKLCIQKMDQIPDSAFPTSPAQISPKKIIEENWGPEFETYMIKPGEVTDEVAGTVWELTPLQRELVRDWELVDLGWYKDMKGKAVTKDGKEVEIQTEGFREGQEVDREINGKEYLPFLNRVEDFQRVAEKSRREYLDRNNLQEEISADRRL